MKLNLACGHKKLDGFLGVDMLRHSNVDIVHDLKQYPWPFDDNSVDEIICEHFIEHLDGLERLPFFDECWRIMKPEATMLCITPGAFTSRYMQDPTHKFPMVVWEFYNYLNADVRKKDGLDHCPVHCNFYFEGHHSLYEGQHENSKFAENYYLNSVHDLRVTLKKLP